MAAFQFRYKGKRPYEIIGAPMVPNLQRELELEESADAGEDASLTYAELAARIGRSELILLKKLSRNDVAYPDHTQLSRRPQYAVTA